MSYFLSSLYLIYCSFPSVLLLSCNVSFVLLVWVTLFYHLIGFFFCFFVLARCDPMTVYLVVYMRNICCFGRDFFCFVLGQWTFQLESTKYNYWRECPQYNYWRESPQYNYWRECPQFDFESHFDYLKVLWPSRQFSAQTWCLVISHCPIIYDKIQDNL